MDLVSIVDSSEGTTVRIKTKNIVLNTILSSLLLNQISQIT